MPTKSHRVTFDTSPPPAASASSRTQRRLEQRLSYILSGGDDTPPPAAAPSTPSLAGSAMLNAFRRLQGSTSSTPVNAAPTRNTDHGSATRGEDRVFISTGVDTTMV